jgi:hypothetical protein
MGVSLMDSARRGNVGAARGGFASRAPHLQGVMTDTGAARQL